MHVTLLGTSGWMPSDRRETTCIASRNGHALLIFDAGTGLRRLGDPAHAALLDDVRDIHLFLTHYHLDHVCGLAYLGGVVPGHQITVHAPEASLTGIEPEVALSGLLRRPYVPHDWKDLTHLSVEPIGLRAEVAGRVVTVRPQRHSDVSVAYRVDDAFVVATDTPADPGTAEFSAGVSLLLHEGWYQAADSTTEGPPPGYEVHSQVEEVARVAASAGVNRLVLIHLNPLMDEGHYLQLEATARGLFAATAVHSDGDVLDTDRVGVT